MECGERVYLTAYAFDDNGGQHAPGELGTVIGHRGKFVLIEIDQRPGRPAVVAVRAEEVMRR